MSIQRHAIVVSGHGASVYRSDEGEYVTYADHVAALDESANTYKGLGYLHGMAAMRSACIAAVEALADDGEPEGVMYEDEVIATLLTVQP